jgi:hypothetical protein
MQDGMFEPGPLGKTAARASRIFRSRSSISIDQFSIFNFQFLIIFDLSGHVPIRKNPTCAHLPSGADLFLGSNSHYEPERDAG